jgi:hypothetical protein
MRCEAEDVVEEAVEKALWARELNWVAEEYRRLDAGMSPRWVMNLVGGEDIKAEAEVEIK